MDYYYETAFGGDGIFDGGAMWLISDVGGTVDLHVRCTCLDNFVDSRGDIVIC